MLIDAMESDGMKLAITVGYGEEPEVYLDFSTETTGIAMSPITAQILADRLISAAKEAISGS